MRLFRFVLNFDECISSRDYVHSLSSACEVEPFWALTLNHFSQTLLCGNACIGFFVYCFMSKEFRNELTSVLGIGKEDGTRCSNVVV